MVDVQGLADTRNIPVQKVGVKNVTYPITVLDKLNRTQHTVATVNLFANLPHEHKGTHMSRFIEVFNEHYHDLSMPRFLKMLERIRAALDAETAFGATLLETAATALERLAASVAAHHRRQAIDRLRPDDRDR